jgi:hypothetical protein
MASRLTLNSARSQKWAYRRLARMCRRKCRSRDIWHVSEYVYFNAGPVCLGPCLSLGFLPLFVYILCSSGMADFTFYLPMYVKSYLMYKFYTLMVKSCLQSSVWTYHESVAHFPKFSKFFYWLVLTVSLLLAHKQHNAKHISPYHLPYKNSTFHTYVIFIKCFYIET